MNHSNPYRTPDTNVSAASPTSEANSNFWPSRLLEWVVFAGGPIVLAGVTVGTRFLPSSVASRAALVAAAIAIASVIYASRNRRWSALWCVPALALAVVGADLIVAPILLFGIVSTPLALLYALVLRNRRNTLSVARALISTGAAFVSLLVSASLQEIGVRRAASTGLRVVEAIEEYRSTEGHLPTSLDELIPEHLGTIPATGMSAFPEFRYSGPVSASDDDQLFASYELRVNLYRWMQFDCFIYWPEGNYPDALYGGGVEVVDGWAYIHE